MTQFKVEDKVTWVSQANGSPTQKNGVVVLVVPPLTSPRQLANHINFSLYSIQFDGIMREQESYLVAVYGPHKPKLYWPRVSALRHAEIVP